jgi:hypothetical protein
MYVLLRYFGKANLLRTDRLYGRINIITVPRHERIIDIKTIDFEKIKCHTSIRPKLAIK